MMFLKFNISNPFFRQQDCFESKIDFFKNFKLTKNKHLEIQLSRFALYDLIGFELDLHWNGRDHQGPALELLFLGVMFRINLYDRRHWDYEQCCWKTYDDQQTHV
jgi:hypothetical protein